MERKATSGIILTLLMISMLTLAFNVQTVKAGIITVPDDYQTIQEAINHANDGDTIFVRAGTYYENVVVNKTLSLIGENRENTIIDGGNLTNTILVTANDVVISGFTVTNSNSTYPNSGIFLDNVRNLRITGNNVSGNNGHGIFAMWGSGNSILDNLVTHNAKRGIRIDGTEAHALVKNNTIEYNQEDGIFLYYAYDVIIENNTVSNNVHCGITPQGESQNVTIRRNLVTNNVWHGIIVVYSFNCSISENDVTANSQDGVQLHESSNCSISGNNVTGNEWAGIYLSASSHNSISGNNIAYNGEGIGLWTSNYTSVSGNNITENNGNGIGLDSSSNNTISENKVTNNDFGISLGWSSNHNPISGNIVTANKVFGIGLHWSSNNTISGNNVTNNNVGITLTGSSSNTIRGNAVNSSGFDGVQLVQSNDNEVSGNEVALNGWIGIWTFQCRGSIISGNTVVSNTLHGIMLAQSNSTTVTDNRVAENHEIGILVGDYPLARASNNTIARNTVSNNSDGICLDYSSNNTLFGNTVTNNTDGIFIKSSSNNTIYHNNFINNTQQVESYDSVNTWDDGYPSGGNYWSNYADVDLYCGPKQNIKGSDGIWDHPYVIDAGNQDNYPLVKPCVSGSLSISIYTDKYTYHAGETMHLGLDFANPDSVKYICLAIWLKRPSGSIYLYMHQHSILLPIGTVYNNPNFDSITLPSLPPGKYTWRAAFLDRSTHKIVVEDTAEWEFS